MDLTTGQPAGLNRRRHERFVQFAMVEFRQWQNKGPQRAYLSDVSWRGARLETFQPLARGGFLNVNLPKWEKGPERRVLAQVMWCAPTPLPGRHTLGCQILR